MSDGPRQAAKVSFAICGCPHIHFQLRDADGTCFASITMDPETFDRMVADAKEQMTALARGMPGACQAVH